MTTNKNFKSKKISNQYTRYFDIKKLLPKTKNLQIHKDEEFGRESRRELSVQKKQFRRHQSKSSCKSNTAKSQQPFKWKRTENVLSNFVTKGSPYLLLSEEDVEQDNKSNKQRAQRDPVCYNVMHEPPPRMDLASILPMIRGIRISICVEHTRFPLISRVSKGMGLTHVPEHRLWNIQWCDNTPHFDLLKSMKRFQQINHFPGMSEICRKDLLSRNLNRMLKMYPGDYRIFPKTWLMPTDAYDVAVYASKHKRTFILKPYSSGQGRGIWLTNNLRNVGRQEKLICQTYIDRPLLIDGYKFDLRVYTLVTSVDPLRIFVYNEGLARFATHKYMPPALGNSSNVYMHLTNYCLNRRNSNYDAGSGTDGGSKRKLSAYNKWLVDHNYNVEEFWAAVDDAIIKTVISAWPVLKHNYHLCFPRHDKIQACFQLLGFDILVDWKLKPYILEVNHTPSLSGDETVDNEVKRPLIRDTLNLISSPLVDKEEIIREDRAVLRDRLMRQAGRRRIVTPTTPRTTAGGELNQACSLGALAQQIAWEESHLGNYRRVMPPTDNERVAYYCKFYDQVKQISMFKETTASKSRMKLNQDIIQQQKAQQLLAAQKELHRQPKPSKNKPQIVLLNFKPSATQLQRQKKLEAMIAQDIQRQQQKLKQHTMGKEAVGIWQVIRKEIKQPRTKFNMRFKSKQSLNTIKTQRRKQRRQLQRRTRRARRLEWESRQDAEFLQRHGIRRPAGTRLHGGSSKQQLSSSSKKKHRCTIKSQKKKPKKQLAKIEPDASSTRCCVKKAKARTRLTKPKPRKIREELNDWLPEPITEADQQWHFQWRKERSSALKGWQLKELLFTEMYEHGDLTKNDIKLFPDMLYRILKTQSDTEGS